uniref:ATP-dependent DNA helicase PIF1-like n=1 Tax=Erigeron canadensis TaxID=72917 RepID=UPI001CB9B0A2|nr:ATP-dependent DNA helicase PIF1-like [Erigeron canadensis]
MADDPTVIPVKDVHIDEGLEFTEEPIEIIDRDAKQTRQSRVPLVRALGISFIIIVEKSMPGCGFILVSAPWLAYTPVKNNPMMLQSYSYLGEYCSTYVVSKACHVSNTWRKTYIWKTLSSAIRSKGEIVLNVASSGIASLLLEGGRTAHSRFRIPININEDSFCSITPDSDLAALIVKTRLIIWDEAPMMHRHCFEALDRTLRDILASSSRASGDKPFGGKVILFGGDFRQILPVIQRGTRAQIVNASINSSDIWRHCTVLRLTENMRLKLGSPQSSLTEVKAFSDWLIQIGEGTIGDNNKGGEADVQFLDDVLIKSDGDHIKAIVDAIYPNINDHLHEPGYFRDKAILVPTNDEVDRINDHVLSLIKAEERTYFSSDRPCETESLDAFQQSLYSPDVLNGFKISGTPNHKLLLKPGVPVMLLRNIDQSKGLCNGTRLQVVRMAPHVIEAKIISGSNVNDVVYIPRMKITPSDIRIPFKFQRRQFPLVVCFAMTINKSQGQSLAQVGLFLQRPVFTHGQLYVALSRVTTKSGLKVLIVDKGGKTSSKTTNVVYKEVLQKI